MSVTGRVHSFESFGTVDGPGIRFVVFMQGCPLRCLYCHNRDTWDARGGREYTVEDILNEMGKYLDFIRLSGGGITVSGGEPTLQAEFVTEVFKKCREMGVHTALDTSGFVEIGRVEELLGFTDLVLLDIKHGDAEKHRVITGVDNHKIKKFALYVSERNIPVWIRYVLVPGYTDGERDLAQAAEFIGQLKSVEKVEVLPYHSMGKYKWDKLGVEYPLEGVESPSPEQVERASRILNVGLSPLNT
ncbi:MAG: pyruvate formate-lyase-activating protein [Clostridiales bacterium]|jgi:pyruvate formate lyase activating enzyme|nr:pyruvate formate-lyase-activating protein [Eubacteriales bacterium]MDH7566748.1 pyruvate formate-lyase-activating protein [Clostridiales bacterium]